MGRADVGEAGWEAAARHPSRRGWRVDVIGVVACRPHRRPRGVGPEVGGRRLEVRYAPSASGIRHRRPPARAGESLLGRCGETAMASCDAPRPEIVVDDDALVDPMTGLHDPGAVWLSATTDGRIRRCSAALAAHRALIRSRRSRGSVAGSNFFLTTARPARGRWCPRVATVRWQARR